MAYLILVRHGESEWNALGQWTGRTDVALTERGREQARRAGELIRDIELHACHCSTLTRARHTLDEIKACCGVAHLPSVEHGAMDERDYGELTGKNKWQVRDAYGEERFELLRRSWDHPIPGGETLKDVYARIVPYYQGTILPQLISGANVLVAFHGNTMRALVKHLDRISDTDIARLEITTGEAYLYQVAVDGAVVGKEIRK